MSQYIEWISNEKVEGFVLSLISQDYNEVTIPITFKRFIEHHHFYFFRYFRKEINSQIIFDNKANKKDFLRRMKKAYKKLRDDTHDLFDILE